MLTNDIISFEQLDPGVFFCFCIFFQTESTDTYFSMKTYVVGTH